MKTALPLPDLETLRSQFSYDPKEGVVRWATKRSGVTCGAHAGTTTPDGYVKIVLDRKHAFAHRVAWKLHYGTEPPAVLDHVNGDPGDNRIANLRAATLCENGANQRTTARNRSGVRGVSLCKQTGMFRASIRVRGTLIALGRFRDLAAAAKARRSAELEHVGAFSPLNRMEA